MAHNLESRKGKTSFVAYGEKAWHGLGTYIDRPMTAKEVVELSGQDYEVQKTPIYIKHGNSDVEVPEVFATYRTDTGDPLGIVSGRYEIVQNSDAFTFFDPVIDRGEAIYQTAGVLGRGERVFITAKLPEDIKIAGEAVEQFLLITNGHDGRNAVKVGFTPIRVVCNNTLTAALSNLQNSVTIYHFNNPQKQLQEAHRIIGLASEYMQGVSELFEEMASVRITDTELQSFIESIFVNQDYVEKSKKPSSHAKKLCQSVYDFATRHHTQALPATDHTLYGAVNAVSGYLTWKKNYENAEKRMKNVLFGNGNTKIKAAFELAAQAMEDGKKSLYKNILCF